MDNLPDIQKTADTREVPLARVGVSDILIPMAVRTISGRHVNTVSTVDLAVSLAPEVKGTHMSRFTEVLNDFSIIGFSSGSIPELCSALCHKLNAQDASGSFKFLFFDKQESPVSKLMAWAPTEVYMDFQYTFGGRVRVLTRVTVAGHTCCPCSRAISDYDEETGRGRGAHSQRGFVTVSVWDNDFKENQDRTVWFEDMIQVARKSFSSAVYPILKREDERAVTVDGYENPKFVEDVVRDTVINMKDCAHFEGRLGQVTVTNFESIHYHNAFADSGVFQL